MGKLFGTDGIRGVAGEDLTADLAFRTGNAVAEVFASEIKGRRPKIFIGKDTRLSGDMFESAVAAGLCAMGSDAVLLGVVPTPAVAYLVSKSGADAGIMISASHNPSEYNGIKVFNGDGMKLSDNIEEKIEDAILSGVHGKPNSGASIGRVRDGSALIADYIDHVKGILAPYFTAPGVTPRKRKILFDLSNGSASATAKCIFSPETLCGCECDFIAYDPDGVNINDNCGSTQMNALASHVAAGGYDIGIAFDGDADRCLITDENGKIIDGDAIMARLALELKREGRLKCDTVVVTKLSNLGFHIMAKKYGLSVKITDVGDRYVLEEMLRGGYSLGGEQSGHIIIADYLTTGDGQSTAALILATLSRYSDKKVSEIFSVMKSLPQVSVNVKVPQTLKKQLCAHPAVAAKLRAVEERLGDRGRVLLRPSGTEALVRIMLEGEDKETLAAFGRDIADTIESISGDGNVAG